ncbi:hypothetical protein FGW37_17165 [Streptomyces rectiverticillatus]|uniref:hypothetical protein n=1 Tax=Streptomyces rectiverticillatus TaxID=173860 RepID=UPI001FE7BABC|nr:hypothetical protein [Streptomyces rectiverticillatus]QLE73093.1 hypothetical protein FGW37_17165 [Streptomyces rectiverticillatus]
MEHEMRAEYPEGLSPGQPDAPVKVWHMVRLGGTEAMCGRDLDPSSATQPSDAWGTAKGEPFCHSCAALYLREVP